MDNQVGSIARSQCAANDGDLVLAVAFVLTRMPPLVIVLSPLNVTVKAPVVLKAKLFVVDPGAGELLDDTLVLFPGDHVLAVYWARLVILPAVIPVPHYRPIKSQSGPASQNQCLPCCWSLLSGWEV